MREQPDSIFARLLAASARSDDEAARRLTRWVGASAAAPTLADLRLQLARLTRDIEDLSLDAARGAARDHRPSPSDSSSATLEAVDWGVLDPRLMPAPWSEYWSPPHIQRRPQRAPTR